MPLKMASPWLTKNGLPNSLGPSRSLCYKNETTAGIVEHLLQLEILSSPEFCKSMSSLFACLLAPSEPSPSCLLRQPLFKMFSTMVSTLQSIHFPRLVTFRCSTSISSSQMSHKCPDAAKTPCGCRPAAPPPSGQCSLHVGWPLQQPQLGSCLSSFHVHTDTPAGNPGELLTSCEGTGVSSSEGCGGKKMQEAHRTMNVAPGFH